MNSWIVAAVVILLYVHLFNTIAKLYLQSGRTLTLSDLWRRFVPPIKISIEV